MVAKILGCRISLIFGMLGLAMAAALGTLSSQVGLLRSQNRSALNELLSVDEFANYIAGRAANNELLSMPEAWPRKYDIRGRVAGLDDLRVERPVELQILCQSGRILTQRRLDSNWIEPNPVWQDPTFSIPWTYYRDGRLNLSYRIRATERDVSKVIAEGNFAMPLVPVDTLVSPWSEDEVAEALVTKTKVQLVWSGASYIARVSIPEQTIPDDVSFAAEMLIISDRRLIGRAYFWFDSEMPELPGEWDFLVPIDIERRAAIEGEELQAFIRGMAKYALRVKNPAPFYWAGGYLVPATIDFGQSTQD